MIIPWYEDDIRFEPGTTADLTCLRLYLKEGKKGWRLLVKVRKADHSLSQSIKVMDIGHCSLEEAQKAAEQWYSSI